uniref:PCI domain-containing protein n=1 Tax=Tetradesmus obliquus TaxID=3088 RepID=A0A383WN77_TETOB|eukprot:jgi/Sobl393_1/13777/SZX78908.1
MVQEQVAAAAADAAVPAKDAEQQQPKPFSVKEGMQGIVSLLEKSVKTKETRLLMGRLMRQTAMVRKHMTASDLARFVKTYLPQDSSSAGFLQGYLKQDADVAPMEDDATAAAADAEGGGDAGAASGPSQLPEVELYSYLLVLVYLLDRKHFRQAREVADAAVGLLQQHNRRTLDAIGARIYFYYSWAYECTGALADVRSTLMAAHCTAGLRHDAAEKFRSKAQKADSWRVPGQYCRYLFYLGTIRAIQLEYSEAKEVLQQASRKAPTCAHGFRVACNKWLILVRLLLGEVPEREEFSAPGMRGPLAPYFELTCAVRSGDLAQFRAASDKFAGAFRADRTTNLITRLQYNVIRTGLRRINLAYSRISLKDVAEKLALPSAVDAEYICAKAIRDGGIDAVLDHAGGFLATRELTDLYSTNEPQAAFHERIAFCLNLHNEAVKAMRFEPDAHKRALAAANGGKESMSVEEIARAIEEEEDDEL